MSAALTYVRKIGDGQFEYGFRKYCKNFRKQRDVYTPAGVEASVSAAESRRAELSPPLSVTGVNSNA